MGLKRVSKTEFVWLMILLAAVDRERYRELRARGWSEARVFESESPN
jgi:hypothetical protein